MSLFRRILESVGDADVDAVRSAEWQTVEGSHADGGVYVYDGKPLRGISSGQEFYAEVVTRPTKLRSTLTGTTWNTKRDGGVALAVDGRVFGATRTYEVTFRKLASAGGPVRVRMRRSGTYAKGIPTVEMLLPDSFLMNIAGELGYLPPTDAEVVILYIREWSGPRVGDKYVRLPVTTRTVPTPAGSSAKPHVIVSAAGTDVADISARSTFYSTLARHVGEPPLDAFCQMRESSDGHGAHYWRLVVIWTRPADNPVGR